MVASHQSMKSLNQCYKRAAYICIYTHMNRTGEIVRTNVSQVFHLFSPYLECSFVLLQDDK